MCIYIFFLFFIFKEHPSSDSFYDSDGDGGSDLTTLERPGKNASQQEEEVEERQRHDSAEVDGTQIIFIHKCIYITYLNIVNH